MKKYMVAILVLLMTASAEAHGVGLPHNHTEGTIDWMPLLITLVVLAAAFVVSIIAGLDTEENEVQKISNEDENAN